jgi:immunity protein 17 of polymorphic toxin system
MNFTALFLIAAGLYGSCGGMFDWEWFINNRKPQFFVSLLGRTGTRIFYVLLGSATAVVGA